VFALDYLVFLPYFISCSTILFMGWLAKIRQTFQYAFTVLDAVPDITFYEQLAFYKFTFIYTINFIS
jgi:hypothetical protein